MDPPQFQQEDIQELIDILDVTSDSYSLTTDTDGSGSHINDLEESESSSSDHSPQLSPDQVTLLISKFRDAIGIDFTSTSRGVLLSQAHLEYLQTTLKAASLLKSIHIDPESSLSNQSDVVMSLTPSREQTRTILEWGFQAINSMVSISVDPTDRVELLLSILKHIISLSPECICSYESPGPLPESLTQKHIRLDVLNTIAQTIHENCTTSTDTMWLDLEALLRDVDPSIPQELRALSNAVRGLCTVACESTVAGGVIKRLLSDCSPMSLISRCLFILESSSELSEPLLSLFTFIDTIRSLFYDDQIADKLDAFETVTEAVAAFQHARDSDLGGSPDVVGMCIAWERIPWESITPSDARFAASHMLDTLLALHGRVSVINSLYRLLLLVEHGEVPRSMREVLRCGGYHLLLAECVLPTVSCYCTHGLDLLWWILEGEEEELVLCARTLVPPIRLLLSSRQYAALGERKKAERIRARLHKFEPFYRPLEEDADSSMSL
eukprot:gnl/Dysnectes_brevis/5676_a8295_352.p1 GENE.gnl/Dysnectes_brevis/5676_a8295_352~~gnl/Dysnectes_brevis/5676_a8295_352.p1  ORF type:complete len:497 (-),score=121.34 gnl/Dysnectes_brevis/5676_a8295_352:38-1528(-)